MRKPRKLRKQQSGTSRCRVDEDSVSLYLQKPKKCHLISQKRFKDDKYNPNNIVFMSRNLRQQFDAIDSSAGIPMFYLTYVRHSTSSMQGSVSGQPCQVYETTVGVVFKEEETMRTLAPFMIPHNTATSSTGIQITLHFPAPLEFKEFAGVNAETTMARWRS